MVNNKFELLVLDAHGVVLSNPFFEFLDQLAMSTGQAPEDVRHRWRNALRTPTWTGKLAEDDLWQQLSGGDGRSWRDVLEGKYQLGPAAPHLSCWSKYVPIWLLSNHRSDWLIPRLERFELTGFFERVVISDMTGFAKPHLSAYIPIMEHIRDPTLVTFVDDRSRNVTAAASLGLNAIHASLETPWIATVNERLGRSVMPV